MACAKLREALFLGDFEAAHDLEFIIANKISRVVNCAGRELTNPFERSGLRYLTYYWPQSGNCVIFDESNAVLDEIYSFIEEALDAGEAVLIHSTDGVSRASFCACVYFMLRYRWTLPKTLLYLQSKRPDLQPQQGFMRQLQALDASLQRVIRATARGPSDPAVRRCSEWDPAVIAKPGGGAGGGGAGGASAMPAGADASAGGAADDDDDELLLVHTFLNSQPVSEDVILAAQSGVPLNRPTLGLLSHAQGSVHFPPGGGAVGLGTTATGVGGARGRAVGVRGGGGG
jgi:protein-tyrosine phosphatase